ncbi:hypothetical protein LNQ52_09655 [Klebsiella pneumoniae subsp. pneumoniae]|nr:hypothetical protein [Klebsiella pneumoniae subsp. pneumoniae]
MLGGLRRGAVMMGAYALICGAMALAMWKLPGSFLPVEDQGEIMVQYTLPARGDGGAYRRGAPPGHRLVPHQRESQYRRHFHRRRLQL